MTCRLVVFVTQRQNEIRDFQADFLILVCYEVETGEPQGLTRDYSEDLYGPANDPGTANDPDKKYGLAKPDALAGYMDIGMEWI